MPDAEALDTFERLDAPTPTPASAPLTRPEMLLAIRRNVLEMWGAPAYREMTLAGPFFGARSIFTNDPDAIRHVLVDNWQNYTRTPATFRILRPMFGDGLLLAEGDEWRRQRRTLSPAFTPRAMAIVARTAAEVMDGEMRGPGGSDAHHPPHHHRGRRARDVLDRDGSPRPAAPQAL